MSPFETFTMFCERLSHSFVDGRLLTAGGPRGEDGLRRLLQEPFVLEELTARLVCLFRIAERVLGLDASGQAFYAKREQAKRLAAAVRTSVASKELFATPLSLRALVLEIRDMLLEMGSDPAILMRSRPPITSPSFSLSVRGERLARLIAAALKMELPREIAEELAREYWSERMAAEEEAVAGHLYYAGAEVAVCDSLQDVLLTLRLLDDVAGIALATRGQADERRARCERMLDGSIANQLADLTASLNRVPNTSVEMEH